MLSQNDVTQFSQNIMPYTRGRSRTRSGSRKRARASSSSSSYPIGRSTSGRQSYAKGKTWPWQSDKTYAIAYDPFPAVMRARLRYATIVSINPTVGAAGYHLFRANSIADPDYTGVGHQPYGHDTYAGIYDHYRVISSRITAIPTVALSGIYGIAKTDDAVVGIDMDTVREQKGTNVIASTGAGQDNAVITNYYSEKEMLNKNDLQASPGANPTDVQYYQLFLTGPDYTTDLGSKPFMINITYDVVWWELKDLGQS